MGVFGLVDTYAGRRARRLADSACPDGSAFFGGVPRAGTVPGEFFVVILC
jgi:hypothetical protein